VCDEHLGDHDRAIEAYRTIPLDFGEEEVDAYRALDGLYERLGRWDDLSQTIEHRIDLGPASDEELAALKFRLADVLRQHLRNKERSLDLYCEVVTIMPEHDGAQSALEELLPDPELGPRAASVLEPLYEGRGDWARLIHALEVLAASTPEQQAFFFFFTGICEIYSEQLGDQDKAFEVYCRAMRETPQSPGIAARLEELGRARNKLAQMVALLTELATDGNAPDLAKHRWAKAAVLREHSLNDIDGAVAAYSKALELDEDDMEILGALESVYRRTERYKDLLGVLRRKAARLTVPSEREQVLGQMAAIHDEMLNEPDEAILIYGEVLEMDPSSALALAARDGL